MESFGDAVKGIEEKGVRRVHATALAKRRRVSRRASSGIAIHQRRLHRGATGRAMTLTVLHAIPSFVGGGAERQLSLLAPELCRLGVRHARNLRAPRREPGAAARFASAPAPDCLQRQSRPAHLAEAGRLIRDLRPDLVQTWLPQMDVFAGVAARLTRTPFVLSERSSAPAYSDGWKNRLRRRSVSSLRPWSPIRRGGVDYWRPVREPRDPQRAGAVRPSGRPRQPRPKRSGCRRNARIVLFAGRLTAEKNFASCCWHSTRYWIATPTALPYFSATDLCMRR